MGKCKCTFKTNVKKTLSSPLCRSEIAYSTSEHLTLFKVTVSWLGAFCLAGGCCVVGVLSVCFLKTENHY